MAEEPGNDKFQPSSSRAVRRGTLRLCRISRSKVAKMHLKKGAIFTQFSGILQPEMAEETGNGKNSTQLITRRP